MEQEINKFSKNYGREEWKPIFAHDYFLTYSRCSVPKEELEKSILKKISNELEKKNNFIQFIVVAHEEHEVEGDIPDHLHAYIRFEKEFYTKYPNKYDFLHKNNNYHPQIGAVNNPIGCMKYTLGLVEKKGNRIGDIWYRGVDPIKFVTDDIKNNTPTSPKSSRRNSISSTSEKQNNSKKNKSQKQELKDDIFRKLMNHEISLIDSLDIIPSLLTSYNSLKKNLERYMLDKSIKNNEVKKLNNFTINDLDETFGNYKKCPQYWICGPSNTGKNNFIRNLISNKYDMYLIPKNKDHRHYSDNKYSAAYIDELNTGHITYDFINEFTQGDPMLLNYKGASVMKTDHFPVFFLSNLFPWEVYYKETYIIDTVLNRMKIIYTYKKKLDDGSYTYHAKCIWDPTNNNTNYPKTTNSLYQFSESFKDNEYNIPNNWFKIPNYKENETFNLHSITSQGRINIPDRGHQGNPANCDSYSRTQLTSDALPTTPTDPPTQPPNHTWQGPLPEDIILNNNKYIIHKIKIRRKYRYRDDKEKAHNLEVDNIILNKTEKTMKYTYILNNIKIERNIDFYTFRYDMKNSGHNLSEYIVYMYNTYMVNVNEFN